MFTPPEMIMWLLRSRRNKKPSSSITPMSPTVKNPFLRFSAVFSGSSLYSKSWPVPMRMYTVPTSPGASSLPSSSMITTSELGHALPTVPGFSSHSSGVTRVPPPSVAA